MSACKRLRFEDKRLDILWRYCLRLMRASYCPYFFFFFVSTPLFFSHLFPPLRIAVGTTSALTCSFSLAWIVETEPIDYIEPASRCDWVAAILCPHKVLIFLLAIRSVLQWIGECITYN